jgi:hypothetical protein
MADSDLSASELRRRYHKGGTAADDELTAAQLRARHGIAPNKQGTARSCVFANYCNINFVFHN